MFNFSRKLLFGVLALFLSASVTTSQLVHYKDTNVCTGTSDGMTNRGSTVDHVVGKLRTRYTNCTHVKGNLEITFIYSQTLNDGSPVDLSFLRNIREVSGYLLIAYVVVDVPLDGLYIVRGQEMFSYVELNFRHNYSIFTTIGVDETGSSMNIALDKLQEVSQGNVHLGSFHWCYGYKVNWTQMFPDQDHQFAFITTNASTLLCPNQQDLCSDCESGHCWGPGEDRCQIMSRDCWSSCGTLQCFSKQPSDCCHWQCAAGCVGPDPEQCNACKSYQHDSTCQERCEPPTLYDHATYTWKPNDKVQYAYGSLCLDDCPDQLYKDPRVGMCTSTCADDYRVSDDGKSCVYCDPKTCGEVECKFSHEFVTMKNIEELKGCTLVHGNVAFVKTTFNDQNHTLNYTHLSYLSDIETITGTVMVFQSPPELTSLDFLSNLRYINNNKNENFGLTIFNTNLKSLGLRSFERVKSGGIYINKNPKLCYINEIKWSGFASKDINVVPTNCTDTSCSEHCLRSAGCWGPSSDECLECKHFRYDNTDTCVSSCQSNSSMSLYVSEPGVCSPCHAQCKDGCTGPTEANCTSCRNVKDGVFCRSECPQSKYEDENKVCQDCHTNCYKGPCAGPLGYLDASNGCLGCEQYVQEIPTKFKPRYECLNASECAEQEYSTKGVFIYTLDKELKDILIKHQVCRACHPQCNRCHGAGPQSCLSCQNLARNVGSTFLPEIECVAACNQGEYASSPVLGDQRICRSCNDECKFSTGCHGPNSTECVDCKNYKMWINLPEQECPENATVTGEGDDAICAVINCIPECPEDLPYYEGPLCRADDPYAATNLAKKNGMIAGIVLGVVALVALVVIVVFCYRRSVHQRRSKELSAKLSGIEEQEPLNQSSASPDLSHLLLLNESELKTGAVIGSGAFGTVYKGVWMPPDKNVKIPVAIKVLQDATLENAQELLDEARIMCSVIHPCCVRVLGICMGSQIQLVTPLMPYGSLLDYVRLHRQTIGSKALLNWSTQIAKGMAHLEERGIVHRDLAARNVLVHSPYLVKITDFGLSKLLDINEDVFRAQGGKMPIKWLALECMTHRIFTHKTDVWSYGVTVWELCSYGARPYEGTHAADILYLLEKGERLPQPEICTIDVYMILIKCWMKDPMSRPTFKQLVADFSRMAQDPGRYLVIKGDEMMRMPSYQPQDSDVLENEFDNVPGRLMNADDYLKPSPLTDDTSGFSGWELESKPGAETVSPEEDNGPRRYNHLEGRQQQLARPSSDGQPRYSTDPLCQPDRGGLHVELPNAPPVPYAQAPIAPARLEEDEGYLEPQADPDKSYVQFISDAGPEQSAVTAENPVYFSKPPQNNNASNGLAHRPNPVPAPRHAPMSPVDETSV